jgi:ABC-2 type transport system ATP-binding protein
VLFNGDDIDADPIAIGRVGYVPEEAQLYSYMTGPEYLSLVGRLRGIERRRLESKIGAMLELFHLEDARHAVMARTPRACGRRFSCPRRCCTTQTS